MRLSFRNRLLHPADLYCCDFRRRFWDLQRFRNKCRVLVQFIVVGVHDSRRWKVRRFSSWERMQRRLILGRCEIQWTGFVHKGNLGSLPYCRQYAQRLVFRVSQPNSRPARGLVRLVSLNQRPLSSAFLHQALLVRSMHSNLSGLSPAPTGPPLMSESA